VTRKRDDRTKPTGASTSVPPSRRETSGVETRYAPFSKARRLEDSISLISFSPGMRRPVAFWTRSTSSSVGETRSIHAAAPRSSFG
jgi:hypothetical protein